METHKERYLLANIVFVLFKHKYKIVAAFFAVLVAVTIKTALSTPIYESHSSLMVKPGRESLYRPEVGDDSERVTIDMLQLVKTESIILTSADVVEEAITVLGVENIYPDMVQASPKEPGPTKEIITRSATFRFKGQLSAHPAKNSNVINVSFKHKDPQVAAQAVNQLIESLKEKHIEIFSNPRAPFMEKQLALYRQRLQESENNLFDFKQKNRVFSIDQQRTHLLQQQVHFDTSVKEAQREIQELHQQISSVTSQMKTIPKYELASTATGKSKNIDDAQHKLLNLKIKEQELLTKFNGKSRYISNVRKEIHLIQDYLSHNGLKAVTEREVLSKNTTYQELEASLLDAQTQLSSEKASISSLEQLLNQVNGELVSLDAHSSELGKLKREVETNEENFKNYLTKLEDARTEEQLDLMRAVNISVIQKATVPLSPIMPNKRFNLLVGIVLGVMSGLALAIFSEYCTGRGFCTPEGVESDLGLPVLATVSYKEQNRTQTILKMMTFASLFLLLFLLNACSTTVKSPTPYNPRVVQEPSDTIEEYTIHPNDQLKVKFFYNPELSETVTVRPDGRISLQFAHEIIAAGLTPSELTAILKEKYSTEFVDPQLAVIIQTYGGQMAFVDGEVALPKKLDLFTDGADITVSQAIAIAGGLKDTARRNEVRVIRRKADKKPLVIPVNLNQVWNGTDINQDIVLQPYDIVYVPRATIANVNLWVQQYFYNNIHVGFGYSVNKLVDGN